jgi:6-phosphogluconolactonase
MHALNWQEFGDSAQLARAGADCLEAGVRAGLARRGLALLAGAGGNTPGPIYDLLAQAELDWARVQVLLTDERCVPPDHGASNAHLLRARLLQGPAAAAQWLALEEGMAAPWPLDAALFGMGADAHTLSWFPRSAGLKAALQMDGPRAAVPIIPDPLPPEAPFARISLNRAAIEDAGIAVLAFTGPAKRAAFEAAMQAKPEDAPVRALVEALGPRLQVMWAR